jgi:hypothetical protein
MDPSVSSLQPTKSGRVYYSPEFERKFGTPEIGTLWFNMNRLPPHLIVPAVILMAGAGIVYRSPNRLLTGLMVLGVAVVVSLICSGTLILYERLFGRIEN